MCHKMSMPNNIEDMEELEISLSARGTNLCRTTTLENCIVIPTNAN